MTAGAVLPSTKGKVEEERKVVVVQMCLDGTQGTTRESVPAPSWPALSQAITTTTPKPSTITNTKILTVTNVSPCLVTMQTSI